MLIVQLIVLVKVIPWKVSWGVNGRKQLRTILIELNILPIFIFPFESNKILTNFTCSTGLCNQITCPDMDGFYEHPQTCLEYVKCIEGKAYLEKCPSNLHYNLIRGTCVHKEESDVSTLTVTNVAFNNTIWRE